MLLSCYKDNTNAYYLETDFLKAGFAVFSNAKNHRRDPLVPLVVPTVNISHLGKSLGIPSFDTKVSDAQPLQISFRISENQTDRKRDFWYAIQTAPS